MCLVAQCVLHISWNLSVVLFAWQNDDGEGPELELGQKKNQTFMKLSSQKKSIKNAKNATRKVQPYSTCIKNPFFHGTTRLDSSE